MCCEVVDARTGSKILAQAIIRMGGEKLADIRAWIVQIPKASRARGTNHNARGRRFIIDPWLKPVRRAAIDALVTEAALLSHAPWSTRNLRSTPARNSRVVAIKRLPVERAGTIGASNLTVSAADAAIVVHHHNSICALLGRFHHAHFNARGIFALHTWSRAEDRFPILHSSFNNPVP